MSRAPRPGRVLLIENDKDTLAIMMEAFTRIGVATKIDIVGASADALDYLLRRGAYERRPGGDPLVILLGLGLPGRESFSVLRECKSDPRLQVVPVVVIASSQNQADVATSYDCGANAFVVRSPVPEQFARTMQELGTFWILLNEPPPDGLSIHSVSR